MITQNLSADARAILTAHRLSEDWLSAKIADSSSFKNCIDVWGPLVSISVEVVPDVTVPIFKARGAFGLSCETGEFYFELRTWDGDMVLSGCDWLHTRRHHKDPEIRRNTRSPR